ncbi:MAG: cytochrome P450 [Acidimicrobiales bacterium]|nr:cytochrome P450 [Acidimicrobiales bacterium]
MTPSRPDTHDPAHLDTPGRTDALPGPDDPAVAFDPFEPGFVASPYEQYARLRAHDPVHWSPLLDGWVLTRHDDVVAVLRDPTVSVELDNARPTGVVDLQRERQSRSGRPSNTVVLLDDPDHNRLRKLLQQPFGPRPVDALRAMVTDRVDAAIAELAPRGEMDVVADFAYPLPVAIFNDMLGLPDEDAPRVREWIQAVARMLDPVLDDDEYARCQALMDEMYEYLDGQVEAKRRAPADDVLTALVQAEEDGDRLTRDELVAQVVTLYVAGHEPTMSLVGTGLLALLRQPDQLALLRARPELLPNAINELLRYDGPNQFVRRIATQPMAIGGREVAPGDVLYPCVGAANRDPQRWEEPDLVRVDRSDAAHHVQFGSGVHHCLGAHLARLQAEVALGALVLRLDDVALAGEPAWSERMVIRGLQSLPIAYRPA